MEEELTSTLTPLQTGDFWELMLRFGFNFIFCWIIIGLLYYPKSRRRDFYFTFTVISVSTFFLIYLLGSVKIKVGFALGLFAIFGIIRYRTESMSVREMTYLFAVIAVSVINALALTLHPLMLLAVNLIFVLCIYFSENLIWQRNISDKLVLYDRVDLIVPEKRKELLDDLRSRLGVEVTRVDIGAVDFLRDTVMLKVFYVANDHNPGTIDKMLKLPKEHQ